MLIGALVKVFPWIAAWFVLDTSQGKQVVANITGAEKAILQAPVDVAIKGWLVVAGVTAGLGLLIWYSESKLSQHQGTGALTPTAEPVRVAGGPSFGASGGTSVAAGPVHVGGGINSGGGGGGGVEYASGHGGGSVGYGESSSARRAQRASSRATVAESKARELRAKAAIKQGFA